MITDLNCQSYPFKLSSLNDYPLGDGPVSPTGQFKWSLDSVT